MAPPHLTLPFSCFFLCICFFEGAEVAFQKQAVLFCICRVVCLPFGWCVCFVLYKAKTNFHCFCFWCNVFLFRKKLQILVCFFHFCTLPFKNPSLCSATSPFKRPSCLHDFYCFCFVSIMHVCLFQHSFLTHPLISARVAIIFVSERCCFVLVASFFLTHPFLVQLALCNQTVFCFKKLFVYVHINMPESYFLYHFFAFWRVSFCTTFSENFISQQPLANQELEIVPSESYHEGQNYYTLAENYWGIIFRDFR